MKVTIVGTAYPYRGGLAAFNERLANEFKKEGDEVKIETFTLQYPNFLFPGKTQYSTEQAPQGLDITRSVSSVNPFNWVKIGRKIAKDAPDLLIIKYWIPFMAPCFGTIARLARRNGVTKVVSILDNIIPHEKRLADRLLSNYFVGSVDAFVAMSKSVLHDLTSFDDKKPQLFCAHPLYDNFGEKMDRERACADLGLDPSLSYILFFGFIRDYKGLDILLEAMADERMRNRNVKLIVAGEFYNNSSHSLAYFRDNMTKRNCGRRENTVALTIHTETGTFRTLRNSTNLFWQKLVQRGAYTYSLLKVKDG